MTTSPQTERERAENEAAAWLVLLSDQPDDVELLGRFEAWRAASALNAEIWARTARAYDLVGKGEAQHRDHWASYAPGRAAERALPPAYLPPPPAAARRLFTPRRLTIGAAGVAVTALLMIVVLPGVLLRLQADVATATGEVRAVSLEDGSRVSLAPDSAIDVAFVGRERRVRLLKGEVFFDVAHDPARPFSVAAGDTVATVLGTAFDVRRDDNGTVVAVQRGHVRVEDGSTTPTTSADLHPGDWVHVIWGQGAETGKAAPDEIADWQRGQLIAHNRPAGEIVDALRRYYHGAIIVHDDAFAAKHVSGLYDLRDPVKTLSELATAHGATVRRISPWLLVVTRG
ncbi:MAG: FecR family protein [Proteobacteria bacterium]|nr:FecR family protein [Pseudomonadota bacterium]